MLRLAIPSALAPVHLCLGAPVERSYYKEIVSF